MRTTCCGKRGIKCLTGSYPGLPFAVQPGLSLPERSTDPRRSLRPSQPAPAQAAWTQHSAGSTASASQRDVSECANAPHLCGPDTEETRWWENPAETEGCNNRAILSQLWCSEDRWSDSVGRRTASSEDSAGLPWIKQIRKSNQIKSNRFYSSYSSCSFTTPYIL